MRNIRLINSDFGAYLRFNFGMCEDEFEMKEIIAITLEGNEKLLNFHNSHCGVSKFSCFDNVKESFNEISKILAGLPNFLRCSKNCVVNTDFLVDISSVCNKSKDVYRLNLHFEDKDLTCHFKTERELKISEMLLRYRLQNKENNINV